jgi:hypothetical protein
MGNDAMAVSAGFAAEAVIADMVEEPELFG